MISARDFNRLEKASESKRPSRSEGRYKPSRKQPISCAPQTAPTLVEIDQEASVRELVPRLLDADQIADLMSLDKRSIYRLVHEGKFPRPTIEIGRYKRWRASDYVAFVDAQDKRHA